MSEPIKLPFVLDPNQTSDKAMVPHFLIKSPEEPKVLDLNSEIDINDATIREMIAETMIADIDDYSFEKHSEGHRKHLGGSIIGKPCSRELWYSFRWAKKETFESESVKRTPGQLMRLFQRGHREETPLTQYLEGIGCVFDATKDTQLRISDCEGHFGGSLDNVGTLPPKFKIPSKVLFEFKTSNMALFNKLKKEGLRKHKPIHFSQMCVYGYKTGIQFGCYVCVDKNTDELYIEIVKLDFELAAMMIEKAARIITATYPPPKIAQTVTHFSCKWCSFKQICHYNEPTEKNCRSCANAVPLENGNWGCNLYGPIPENIIPIGCHSYTPLPT